MASAAPERAAIKAHQLDRLRELLRVTSGFNPFYQRKFQAVGFDGEIKNLEAFLERAPFTTKAELLADHQANPPFGTNRAYDLREYSRFHQTSGTSSGVPMPWLDTPESWQALVDSWKQVFLAAGVTAGDRVYFAFSFGPFIGFWLAFEAAAQLECLCLPGGGLSSEARLRSILANEVSVVCCTPTYAIRLGEVALRRGIDLGHSRVRTLIVAGEPGASIPATRERLQELWPGARPFDHHGMTETGPVTYESPRHPGFLNVIETDYLAEIIDPETCAPVEEGEAGELVLTTLTRVASPVIRYRTGDLVKATYRRPTDDGHNTALGSWQMTLEGGILGRCDDMIIVRGVNVYPSAVEEVVRRVGGVVEYQARIRMVNEMAELEVTVEPEENCLNVDGLLRQLSEAFQSHFSLRVPVKAAPAGSLPRFEMKAHRWIRETSR